MKTARVMLRGPRVEVLDVDTGRELFSTLHPKTRNALHRLVQRAAARGYILDNVRDGRIWSL